MEFFKIATQLRDDGTYPAVLATLVQVEGSSYRRAGARLLWSADGRRWGSISGGCLEADLTIRARALLDAKLSHEHVSYDTTQENDLIWGVGTGCHGTVHIFLEAFYEEPIWLDSVLKAQGERRAVTLSTTWVMGGSLKGASLGTALGPAESVEAASDPRTFTQVLKPSWKLVVFGAGDDACPLVEMAKIIQWQVEVIDSRPQFASPARFPAADRVRCLGPEDSIARSDWDDRTVAVIMTHHYVYDLPLLKLLLPLRLPFLGLLGPKERGRRLITDAGADEMDASLLHSPVGLDLGGDGPSAVALSILAEIHATLNQRDARPLRERVRPIHADG